MNHAAMQSDYGTVGLAGRETGLPPHGRIKQGEVRMLDGSDDKPESLVPEEAERREGALPDLGPDAIGAAFAQRFQQVADEIKSSQRMPVVGIDAVLSRAVVLMMKSPEHAQIPIADLEWLLLPPIMLGQYKLYNSGLVPVAFAAWGLFSEAVEQRYLAGGYRLTTVDWKSGDRVRLVHLVAPFGGKNAVIADLESLLSINTILPL
jgi:cytolysin-activating lysine-acyltransferase